MTDRLIPLFAIGAFLAFTLSQAGMVQHWRRASGASGRRRSTWINGVGAVATGMTLVVVAVSKFADGAWIAVIAVPVVVFLFAQVRAHYDSVGEQVADDQPLVLASPRPPVVVVPVQSWNKLTSRGLRFALSLSPDVRALHILTQDSTICELTPIWEEVVAGPAREAGLVPPQLILRKSTFRQFFGPMIDYVGQLRDQHPDRENRRHRPRPRCRALVPGLPAQQPRNAPAQPAASARRPTCGRR